ncbi:class I SAM-dependent methyltransferase [Thermomonas brevis]|uniref:Class I SAM-dependent methyltransferase n=1 Tax=Thermomonas brevis TaxID=215691 RepID=A0A7G9QSE9_9GAMM|nr:class I SAM-dependent methyltransferase [Thermomonas brevis]QNN46274.1 class I SAM-dependent methyltransferase [Thermomonas brevis]
MTLAGIDFARLYREHMAAAGRTPMRADDWDARAAQAGKRLTHGGYADAFIARMDLTDCDSLLDVGCGNGALCLPLAARLRRIVALDYSPAMLDALRADAHAQGADNIDARLCAWEDDWSAIPACDIAIASRSMHVADMADALAKLHAKARRRVYLTHRTGGYGVPLDIVQALEHRRPPPPDHLYVLNLLHGMGLQPRVDYLDGGGAALVTEFDDLLRRTVRALGPLDADQQARLRRWHERQPPLRMLPRRWAFIRWETARD